MGIPDSDVSCPEFRASISCSRNPASVPRVSKLFDHTYSLHPARRYLTVGGPYFNKPVCKKTHIIYLNVVGEDVEVAQMPSTAHLGDNSECQNNREKPLGGFTTQR